MTDPQHVATRAQRRRNRSYMPACTIGALRTCLSGGAVRRRRRLTADNRKSRVKYGPVWCLVSPDHTARHKPVRLFKETKPHHAQMRTCRCMRHHWRGADSTKAVGHRIAAIGNIVPGAQFALQIEVRSGKDSVGGTSASRHFLALAAPALANRDRLSSNRCGDRSAVAASVEGMGHRSNMDNRQRGVK